MQTGDNSQATAAGRAVYLSLAAPTLFMNPGVVQAAQPPGSSSDELDAYTSGIAGAETMSHQKMAQTTGEGVVVTTTALGLLTVWTGAQIATVVNISNNCHACASDLTGIPRDREKIIDREIDQGNFSSGFHETLTVPELGHPIYGGDDGGDHIDG